MKSQKGRERIVNKARPISTKGQMNTSQGGDCYYFECLIFIGEEFRFRWRCYKLQRSSTDMQRTCARYNLTYQLTSRLMFGLVDLYFAV